MIPCALLAVIVHFLWLKRNYKIDFKTFFIFPLWARMPFSPLLQGKWKICHNSSGAGLLVFLRDLVEFLITNHAGVNKKVTGGEEKSPLHYAASKDSKEINDDSESIE